ncbi:hypothetical protein PTTG_29138 [Puccinia triticina 1-1 BBBD Race 1]|uniref:Myb_DNA-bind_3 domain-containing protein n=1 Tax=Puccinia triticina (isolate 1-1 / race 1 (BBBD)) TaxID=630390 RepID=A0A180G698_PUCT1|nr:hypothetical protein PTTG_29138 [Puccinia triticina 1-1 BBBD Race 1]
MPKSITLDLIDPVVLKDTIPPQLSSEPRSPNSPPTPAPMSKSTVQPQQNSDPKKATQKAKPKKKSAEPKKDNESDSKTPNHIWTTNQKMCLLESIATQYAAGHETDNGNLKKEAWSVVRDVLNKKYSLTLSLDQIKNQKNALRTLYLDYKFLRDQKLITAHPRRNFGKLKDKPFLVYDLANSVFLGKAATGEIATSKLFPTTTEAAKLTSVKRKIVTLSDDDSGSDVDIENALIKSEMESISSAINTVSENSKSLVGEFYKIASALTNQKPSNPSTSAITPSEPTVLDVALQECADQYLGQVLNETYIEFALVLENKSKAHTFLSLCRTSNDEVCQLWLEKKVEEAKKNLAAPIVFSLAQLNNSNCVQLGLDCAQLGSEFVQL